MSMDLALFYTIGVGGGGGGEERRRGREVERWRGGEVERRGGEWRGLKAPVL